MFEQQARRTDLGHAIRLISARFNGTASRLMMRLLFQWQSRSKVRKFATISPPFRAAFRQLIQVLNLSLVIRRVLRSDKFTDLTRESLS